VQRSVSPSALPLPFRRRRHKTFSHEGGQNTRAPLKSTEFITVDQAMKYDEFIDQVQKRAHLTSKGEAEIATLAALETLAECLPRKERNDIASQIPRSLAVYLKQPSLGPVKQPPPSTKPITTLEEFFQRMSIREAVPPEIAREHAHAVLSVLADALSKGELEDIITQLPLEFYYEFFEGRIKILWKERKT
jgi:uncharacterized protein (DUF2267 family)